MKNTWFCTEKFLIVFQGNDDNYEISDTIIDLDRDLLVDCIDQNFHYVDIILKFELL